MTASVVDIAINPNNKTQRYHFWNNGRIDAIGGAIPVTNQATWYDRFEPPGVAMHVTDWATGSGYTLDYRGGFNPFGVAPQLGSTASSGPSAGVPAVTGIPVTASPRIRRYVDWSWDPAGTGQGYVLDHWGEMLPFGGASAPPRLGRRFTWAAARKFKMSWGSPKRGMQMDLYGGIRPEFSQAPLPDQGAYWKGHDYARDFVVTSWTDTPAGYKLNLYGGIHPFGAAPPVWGQPERRGADVARKIGVISADNPTTIWFVWSGGQSFEIVASAPPTVTAGGSDLVSPAASVTDTSRPVLSWLYSDPDKDSQAAWQLYVYTQAFVDGHSMTDPVRWKPSALVAAAGADRTTRGVTSPVDLVNGAYRMYVRAQDTAGEWSPWSNYGWTQAVPALAAPTSMTATADPAALAVNLSAGATTGEAADFVRFEYSDDAGVTWKTVDGAGAVPLAATVTAVDRAAPLGVSRRYRAVAYAAEPVIASAPSGVALAKIDRLIHALTVVGRPELGGELKVNRMDWSRPIVSGVFQPLSNPDDPDDIYPIVIDDGPPKARRIKLHLWSLDRAAWQLIEGVATANATLVYRDPFGEVIYCRLAGGDWDRDQLRAAPLLAEETPTRHAHTTTLPLVETRPPA